MKKFDRKIVAIITCMMMLSIILLSPLQALAENEGLEPVDTEDGAAAQWGAEGPALPWQNEAEGQEPEAGGGVLDVMYTVTYYDWDDTLLGEPQSIAEGEAAVEPPTPRRDGYRFTGWSADASVVTSNMDIYAMYVELDSYTVTINYIFANSTIALQPVVFSVAEGDTLEQTVVSPTIEGYTPDTDKLELDLKDVQQDYTYTVTYTPAGDTPYVIEYYLQALDLENEADPLDPVNFTLEDRQELAGQTASQVTAAPRDYTGFSPPEAMPTAQIAADGGTVLRVYYTRDQYAIYFYTHGGSYVAPLAARYEAPITPPEDPARPGYSFTGWTPEVPDTMPAGDLTVEAGWQAVGEVEYTLVYWLEDITSTGYDYVGNAKRQGMAGTVPAIPAGVPAGVTFPITSNRYTLDSIKTNAEKPAAIEGDGSTIVNVYYDRNSYTIDFRFNANKYTLTVGDTTYTASPYTFTAKYGAPIDDVWPGTPALKAGQASDGVFIGWVGGSTNYVTRQYFLNDSIINADPLTAGWSTNSRNITVNYNFQNLDGTGYTLGDTQTVAAQANSTTWNSKTFVGFTAEKSSLPIPTSGPVNFYYTRNAYSMTYYNGGLIDKNTTGVLYQADLSGYGYTPATRPAGVPAGYVFDGWYTTPQAYEGTKFEFVGATMPAHSLILYAHWVKPQYTVTFVPDNGNAAFTQNVYALETVTPPEEPIKPGYVFGGWYLPGASLHYVFSFPVSSDLTLTARWIARDNITYDVVYMVDGEEYDRLSYGGNRVGDSVTATAITIPGYLPDALSKSRTLVASGNEIIFYYEPFDETTYTVRYVDTNGVELLASVEKKTRQASVTENYVNVPGYYPNYYQQTLQLTPNAAVNVITFVYTENEPKRYTVRVFEEALGGGYTMISEEVEYAPAGSVASVTPEAYTGFIFRADLSAISRVVASNGSTLLRLYYDRERYTVDFSAAGNGGLVGQTVFTGIRYETPFGDGVTVPGMAAEPGYRFDRWEPVLPNMADEITADASYVAHFERDDSQWATITLYGNGADSGETYRTERPIGTSYDLPANFFGREGYTFLNWDEVDDGTGTSYAEGETVLITGDLTLFAQWVKDQTYSVVYLNNGGTGSVSDTKEYSYGEPVTVLGNGFVYPGYQFTGWREADGTAYGPGDEFDIERNMIFTAQWAYDEGQWVTIVYDKNDAAATGTMGQETVLLNEQHTLALNQFSLQNHTFTGWNTDADGNGTPYGDGVDLTPAASGTLTLFAQWQEDPKYEITYHANNQTSAETEDTEVYANVPHTIFAADTFTYEHHDFVRWTTNDDGSGTSYAPGSDVLITDDIDLYAYWEARRLYEITYKDGFSTGEFEQDGYAEDDGFLDISVASNPFFRLGYDFVDWVSDLGVVAHPGATIYDIHEDTIFTAEWVPTVYTITYDLDGGTVNGVNPTQYTIETPTFALVNPTKPGYTFTGWTGTTLTEETVEVQVGRAQIGDLSFTAHWERDDSQWTTITFESEDEAKGTLEGVLVYEGVIGEAINQARAVAIVYPATVPAENYEFGSWSDAIPAVFPDEDMVITAYWILQVAPPSSGPEPSSGGSSGPVASGTDGGSSSGSASTSASSGLSGGGGSGTASAGNGSSQVGGGGALAGSSGGGTGSSGAGTASGQDLSGSGNVPTGDGGVAGYLALLFGLAAAGLGLLLVLKKRAR